MKLYHREILDDCQEMAQLCGRILDEIADGATHLGTQEHWATQKYILTEMIKAAQVAEVESGLQ